MDKDGNIHILAPFHTNANGVEGYLALVSGDGFPKQSNNYVTFHRKSGSSLKGVVRTAETTGPTCGMTLHGSIEGWHKQQ